MSIKEDPYIFDSPNLGRSQNFGNPVPILQQPKSTLFSGESLESQIQKIQEKELIKDSPNLGRFQNFGNKIKKEDNVGPIQSFSQNIASSFIEFFEDLFNKDSNISWSKHLNEILLKNDRIFYLGNLLILIALYYLLIKYLK
jgi:hypothetical protein